MLYTNLRSSFARCSFIASLTVVAFGCSASDPGSADTGTGGGAHGGAGSAGSAGSAGQPSAMGGTSAYAGAGGTVSFGGTSSTAGASGGGSTSTGGAANGGSTHVGGTGGTSTNGGASSGGTSAGGTSSGGRSAGGAPSGGTSAGGTPGLGAWTTGYAATMFGNSSANDCAGYMNFSDSTNISGSTCASNKSLTIDTFKAGVANNASYYAAPGDLASIWQGPECMCQGGGVGDCSSPPSCPMEQDCGKCVAVKCDPNGTFMDGGSTHVKDCSTTSYVVVEVIDACPHNHPTNVASAANGGPGWCTSKQANHIDLSCSALGDISTLSTNVGRDGWLNVDVQIVPCSLGLGKHAL